FFRPNRHAETCPSSMFFALFPAHIPERSAKIGEK
ncbi:hypothetical protein ABIB40_003506, partial [Pedobacter sp. UYP30]